MWHHSEWCNMHTIFFVRFFKTFCYGATTYQSQFHHEFLTKPVWAIACTFLSYFSETNPGRRVSSLNISSLNICTPWHEIPSKCSGFQFSRNVSFLGLNSQFSLSAFYLQIFREDTIFGFLRKWLIWNREKNIFWFVILFLACMYCRFERHCLFQTHVLFLRLHY